MEAAGEARAAHVHDRVVDAVRRIDLARDLLEVVGGLPTIGVPGTHQALPPPGRHFKSPSSPRVGTPENELMAILSGGFSKASSCEM